MKITTRKYLVGLLSSSLLLASSFSYAKQTEIGIGAIVVDTVVVGKGTFEINNTIDEGDALKTGDKGNTTILFNDESMLTLGPGAHASIEVYDEGSEGKPGRSIIRVHKGQFRYFPGNILEDGGAQFVAVGNKLLGRSANPKNQVALNNTNNGSNQNNGRRNNGNGQRNNDGLTENDSEIEENDTDISTEDTSDPVVTNDVDTEETNKDHGLDASDERGDGDRETPDFNRTPDIIVANAPRTFEPDGTIPGVLQKDESGGNAFRQNQQVNLNNSQSFAGIGPTPPAPEPQTPPANAGRFGVAQIQAGDLLQSTEASGSLAMGGLITSTGGMGAESLASFAENGLSGNVANGLGSFRGAVNVFGRTQASPNLTLLGRVSADSDLALNVGGRTNLRDLGKVSALPTAGVRVLPRVSTFPTGTLPVLSRTDFAAPKIEAPTLDRLAISISVDVVKDIKIEAPETGTTSILRTGTLSTSTAILTAE